MSQDLNITLEALTKEIIDSWDGATMRHYMKKPGFSERIVELKRKQPVEEILPTDSNEQEETLHREQEAEAARLETERLAKEAQAAEVARLETERLAKEAEAAEAARIEAAKPKKIVVDYQIKDEQGNPIGRPTHLEATSEEEMRSKIIEAHVQAARWGNRLKQQKITSLREANQVQPNTPQISDSELMAAMKDLKSDDTTKALEAQRLITRTEVNKQLEDDRKKLALSQQQAEEAKVSYEFMRNHVNDFNPCQANSDLFKEYFKENQLPWTLGNLEIAFNDLESQLAPVVQPVASVPPANPATVTVTPAQAPIVAPAVTTAAAPVVQPTPTATVAAAPPANPVPAQPRPGVNSSVIPGQNSGSRPSATPTVPELTAEEINSWGRTPGLMRKHMQNPAMRARIEAFVIKKNAEKAASPRR